MLIYGMILLCGDGWVVKGSHLSLLKGARSQLTEKAYYDLLMTSFHTYHKDLLCVVRKQGCKDARMRQQTLLTTHLIRVIHETKLCTTSTYIEHTQW